MLLYTLIMSFVNLNPLQNQVDASAYFKNLKLLKFDSKLHHYYYNNEKINASVSQLWTFSYHFYKKYSIDEQKKKKAMEKGKAIHSLLEKHLDNQYDAQTLIKSWEQKYPTLNNTGQGLIKGVEEFVGWHKLITIATELKLVDPDLGIAGSLDYVGFQEETNTIFIVDWKTGAFTMEELEDAKYGCQLQWYKKLFRSNFKTKLNFRLFLVYTSVNKELEIKW